MKDETLSYPILTILPYINSPSSIPVCKSLCRKKPYPSSLNKQMFGVETLVF